LQVRYTKVFDTIIATWHERGGGVTN